MTGNTLQALAREIKGNMLVERTFYIDSQSVSSAQAGGVENRPHWVLDVTFRKDECRVRTGHAPCTLDYAKVSPDTAAPGPAVS